VADPFVTIEIGREPFVATYMVEGDDPLLCEAASRCAAGTMLTVFGPPTPLRAPSDAERALWSAEKKTYMRDANAVCATMLAQAARRPDAFAEALDNGLEEFLGPGCETWRNWVIGSSETNDQHLVLVASPQALRDYAKVVNGPAWYPSARVRPLRWLTIRGWRMRAVYVPSRTNEGSAFASHVVLIWTVGDHTYGVGFHNVHGLRQTLDLDVALARGVNLVAPEANS
jgi:hypothetical protein